MPIHPDLLDVDSEEEIELQWLKDSADRVRDFLWQENAIAVSEVLLSQSALINTSVFRRADRCQ